MNINSAYTAMPEANSSYLACTKGIAAPQAPMDSGTLGLMMLLSTFQYQAPYVNPAYSTAMSQAGKAAFIQSGGQDAENKLVTKVGDETKDLIHSVGITDGEAGTVLGTLKVMRDRQVNFNGPTFYSIKTRIAVGQDHANIGLGITF